MKMEFRSSMIRGFTLLLTAVCLTAGIPEASAQDASTTVYVDALWCRVHAADCPHLILKEQKQTMTLGEADQLGYRIGESGQSGRTDCCLTGYTRQHPLAVTSNDAIGVAEVRVDAGGVLKYHVHGCHRFTPDRDDYRMTLADTLATPGAYHCEHCIERGPGFAQMTQAEWDKLPSHAPWEAPLGWAPSPFPISSYPEQSEIDILLSETLHGDIGIQERTFINPVATVDNFVIMRFFFPVHRWLDLYQAYRSTGDTNVLEQIRGSARNYHIISTNYLSAAQYKAQDPEGMAYMYTMAASAKITLQLALKYPSQVTAGEISEAEDFLMAIIAVLQPTCEDNSNLDPTMGIPKPLADDFRDRAFNRALNGIGTIGMAAAALEDLQTLNSTTAYQSTIDRYRKIIREYIINWKNTGFSETYNGDDYFSYPYSATDSGFYEPGYPDVKLFSADDQGHFSHSMQGCYLLFESVPEEGVDDAFMTALANTIEFNSYTTSGSPQTPSQEAIRPYSRYPYGYPTDRFYLLNAFNDGVIAGQCSTLSPLSAESVNSEYDYRLATFNAQYLKALRQDRTLIHMGEDSVAPPAPPTGLTGTGSNGQVSLDWVDNTESDMASGTYTVYRSETSGGGYTQIATDLSSSAYVDTAVVNDTLYFYVVTATDSNNDGSDYSIEEAAAPFIADGTAPAVPTGLGASVSDSLVTLDWNDNGETDLNSYNIYRSETSESYGAALVTGVIPSEYVDTNVVNGTTYYYKVTAVDHSSNESAKCDEISAVPASYGPKITFGSNNDGVGGFGYPGATGTEAWSLTADSVNYAFGAVGQDEAHTASLMKSYTLDRSDGTTYTIEGEADLTDGYGDDNNRIGVMLFNPTSTQTDDGGGLYLQLNTDGNELSIREGLNGTALATASASGSYSGDSWIGTTINFSADVLFTNIAGTDKIDVDFTFTDQNNNTDTISAQVDAANYTDTYCGFVTKWRQRGDGGTQDAPPVIDYKYFMVSNHTAVASDTTPPAAPTGLGATAGDEYVSLDWADNTEDDMASGTYSVYRSTTSESYGGALETGLFLSSYVDYDVVNGNTYYYKVTATDTNTNESAKSIEKSATPADTTPPSAPTGLTATAGDGSVTLDWNSNGETDLASYSVYRSTTSSNYSSTALATNVSLSATYTDSTAVNGTTYYYVVTAVDDSSNESNDSNEDSATPATPNQPPTLSNTAASGVTATAANMNGSVDNTGGEDPAVTLYWGDNDGGTTSGSWDYAESFGAKSSGSVTYSASSLTPDTTYYYRYYGSNSNGSDWADSTASFTTASGLPQIANQAASGVGATSATMNGEVTSIGGETPTVMLYYGTSDPGQTTSGWDASISFGSQGTGSLSTNITGLTVGETYTYRYAAQNSYGTDWAASAESFTTPVPGVSIADVSGDEGTDTANIFLFAVTLAYAPGTTATVDYTTGTGSATVGSDYIAASGTVTFEPSGPLTQYIPITLVGDSTSESAETFTVTLSNPVQLSVSDGSATGTITDDDSGGTPGSLSIPIAASSDDCEEAQSGSAMDLTGTALNMDGTQIVGLRFQNVTVPAGSIINAASIQFVTDQNYNKDPGTLTVLGDDTGNAAAFSTTAGDLSGRTPTAAQASWSVTKMTPDTTYNTPSLVSIAQEIVSRGDWAGGNSMVFMVDGNPSRACGAYSFEGAGAISANIPTLSLDYTPPAGGTASSLTLSAPNGGQTWTESGTETVTWSTSGAVGNVDILLSTDGGATYSYVLAANTANDGTESVTIPSGTAGSNSKILVIENGGEVGDESDAVFTIQTDLSGYDQWADDHSVGVQTNDFDGDGISNLGEYALDGNPTNTLDQGTHPFLLRSGNGFLFVHPQRSDDTGIIYRVEVTTNLISGIWTNEGCVAIGTNVTGAALNFVTNDVGPVEENRFIRLQIGQ